MQFSKIDVVFLSPSGFLTAKSPVGNIWASSGLYLGWLNPNTCMGLVSKSPGAQLILGWGLTSWKNGSQKSHDLSVKLVSVILGLFLTHRNLEINTPFLKPSGPGLLEIKTQRKYCFYWLKPKAQVEPSSDQINAPGLLERTCDR